MHSRPAKWLHGKRTWHRFMDSRNFVFEKDTCFISFFEVIHFRFHQVSCLCFFCICKEGHGKGHPNSLARWTCFILRNSEEFKSLNQIPYWNRKTCENTFHFKTCQVQSLYGSPNIKTLQTATQSNKWSSALSKNSCLKSQKHLHPQQLTWQWNKSPFVYIGYTSSNGCFSIDMLVFPGCTSLEYSLFRLPESPSSLTMTWYGVNCRSKPPVKTGVPKQEVRKDLYKINSTLTWKLTYLGWDSGCRVENGWDSLRKLFHVIPKLVVTDSLRTHSKGAWKWMRGIRLSPFGIWPMFRGYVSFQGR